MSSDIMSNSLRGKIAKCACNCSTNSNNYSHNGSGSQVQIKLCNLYACVILNRIFLPNVHGGIIMRRVLKDLTRLSKTGRSMFEKKIQKSSLDLIKTSLNYSLEISSVNGLSYLAFSTKRSIAERLFWATAVLLMVVLATWQGLIVYNHYKERPVIITVDKGYSFWKFTFPAVTVCFEELETDNYLKRTFKNLILQYNISEKILDVEFDEFVGYLKDLAFKNYRQYEDYEPYAKGKLKEYLKPEQYLEVLDKVVLIRHVRGSSYIGFPFNQSRPVHRVFTEYGPCMVVNPNTSIFYTPQYFNETLPYNDYNPIEFSSNQLASFVVKRPNTTKPCTTYLYFHAPNEIMEILDRREILENAYVVPSLLNVEIVLASNETLHLDVQQRNCRLPYEHDKTPLEHSPVYSFKLCKFECRIQMSLKYCNCTPYFYRRLAGEPICNLSGLYCLSKYRSNLIYTNDSTINCQACPQNCDVNIYVSEEKQKPYEFLQTTYETSMVIPNKIFVRNVAFSQTDLLVQIGGVFGLFLGCSLLSVVEIIYFLTLRLICAVRRSKTT